MTKVFERDGDGFAEVVDRPFKDENELQALIETSPKVIPWDIDERSVVAREFQTEAGPIDNLILDSEGQIIIIEAKLYHNSQRRQVLGQVLDYAAQLPKFGPHAFIDAIRRVTGRDFLNGWFKDNIEREAFFRQLEQNLSRGSFNMIIAMDRSDDLLRDAVAYLNRSTEFNCLLAEVRLAIIGGKETVKVNTFGGESIREKRPREDRQVPSKADLDDESFLSAMRALDLEAEGMAFLEALKWASENATNEKGTVRSTPKAITLGTGNDCISWYVEETFLHIWSGGDVYEDRMDYFKTITAPWRDRITLFEFTSKKRRYGKMAVVDVKGAMASEFRDLFRFFMEGP